MSLATDRPLVNPNRPAEVPVTPPGRPSQPVPGALDFQRRVEALRPRLIRLAYRYLWNTHDAEEIAQDAIALAWREAATATASTEFGDAWLYRVTINLALNRLRRLQAGPLPPGETLAARGGASPAEVNELTQRVRQAIRELPDRSQAAIVLRDIEGLSYDQMAVILETRAPAVRVLVHRAREAVRQILLTRWPDTFGGP